MKLFCSNYYESLNQYLVDVHEKINISFEFFPPKNNVLETTLWNTVDQLKLLNPRFFSVTYGANSGEKKYTYDIVKKIKQKTGITTVPHLTCIDSNPEELKKIAIKYWNDGVRHVLALRGDILNCKEKPVMYAVNLVKLLKSVADFEITVAAYPEVHPEAYNSEYDLINLKRKVDAGAVRVITQFFFSVDHFLRFRDRCVKNGIKVDIVPGIFPIINFQQLCKFADMSNVNIPTWLRFMFRGNDLNANANLIIGASIAIDMVKVLYSEGVRNFHFYTLNKADISCAICKILGVESKN